MGKPALLLVGSIEISDYLDLLCPPEDLPDFSLGLLQTLKSASIPAWDTFDLYNILDGSPSLPALQAAAEQIGWQSQLERLQHSPYIPLPDEWEKYLAGIDKKQRHEIRRKIRRAEESGRDVHLRIIQENAELEQNIDAFMDLMAFDEEKAKFLTPMMKDHIRLAAKCAFEKECLNLAFLEVDGQNAAGYLSFDYLNRLWVYNSGLNPAFRELSPGWVLLGYLIRWAIEQNFIELDFMRGDEDYKYRFGGQDRFVMRLTLTP
jgi:CelD/BcsL family acetyltransferase involved in cellulose biosynthesis